MADKPLLKPYSDAELREIAVTAHRRENYAKTIPSTLYDGLAKGLLVSRGILPLGDRTPRLASILQRVILETK